MTGPALTAILLAGCLLAQACAAPLAHAAGSRGAVATGAPEATEAALQTMQRGGNAIDAAIAAALMLGVVDGHNSGLGGGCFLLIHLADGSLVAIDGRETAPASATETMYLRDGKAAPELSRTGPLAAGVPGALAAYEFAAQHYGRRPLREHFETAARVADEGFVVNARYAAVLKDNIETLARFPATCAVLLRPDGSPWQPGDRLRQRDLARSYRALADAGSRWFYRGRFAQATARSMRREGGLLTERDFARYRIKLRQPIRTTYRDCEIVGFPPPSSGGVHVAQVLNMIEGFDLRSMNAGSADSVHLLAEALKRAFADRAHWLGDPDFASVPLGLVSKDYARLLARDLQLDAATPVVRHGEAQAVSPGAFGRHTTHFSTADAAGNWVACTATLNTSFGSKLMVPGTGIVLNNQMDDFSAQPGATNYFGLPGASANAVAPGKRPLSSMSPTIVLKNGRPVLAVGASGGPAIISQTLLALVNTIDFEMDLETALRQPRFHHQWQPDQLRVERGVPPEVRLELERRGHAVVETRSLSSTQAVAAEPDAGDLVAVSDPRSGGRAGAW
ncbi:MAG TPA: gamma-glutamyltransferase [Candidatus Paceibacterota bacterium]|nr:gamma-glutamyltransferase [Candidatus Paceibacterota bacterium]